MLNLRWMEKAAGMVAVSGEGFSDVATEENAGSPVADGKLLSASSTFLLVVQALLLYQCRIIDPNILKSAQYLP